MTTAAPAPPTAPKRKRGHETARDMVLSLLVCLLVVAPFVLMSDAGDGGERQIRVVETAPDVASLQQAVPGVPVPNALPAGWRPTSSNLDGPGLRIGYVTPAEEYAEYAARGGDAETFLAEQTGQGRRTADLQVQGRAFQVWSNDEGETSLVLQEPGWTVVVGGLRETADDSELQQLAAGLR